MTDEHPNAALIRRFYTAFAQGDLATAKDCFAEDAVWRLPGRSPIAGEHRGWEGIRAFFGKLRDLSGGTFRAQLTDVLASNQRGVALQHAIGSRGDKRLDVTACQLMEIRDGKIAEVRGHYSDQYALDDFWS